MVNSMSRPLSKLVFKGISGFPAARSSKIVRFDIWVCFASVLISAEMGNRIVGLFQCRIDLIVYAYSVSLHVTGSSDSMCACLCVYLY